MIPQLKLKYRADGASPKWLTQPTTGGGTILTPYITASKRASTTNNSGKAQKQMQGWGHRRRSYGPFDTFTLDKKQ
jgi:hypothetical protein